MGHPLQTEKSPEPLNISCSIDCNSLLNHEGKCKGPCLLVCPHVCKTLCVDGNMFPPPLVPLEPVIETRNMRQKGIFASSMIVMAVLIGAVLLFCILCCFLRVRYLRQRRERREGSSPIVFGTEEDFLDEDQGPAIEHHIWYINTIGLPQSVIDSIAVFKYKKDEVLIEGTDCSVCLNEFQEEDALRLLPKCSHAFHVPCIDTWLRSHKNCPLCRAPIVSDNFDVQVGLSTPTASNLSPRSENSTNGDPNNSGIISHEVGEGGISGIRNGDDTNFSLAIEDETIDANLRNRSRVRSDLILVDKRETKGEAEMQPMRRSVSLDSSSARAIHNAVADLFFAAKQQEKLQLKHSKSKNVSRQASNGSLSIGKLMKSSSIARVLQKGPISMKRSFSTTAKSSRSSSSRRSRSQDSVLPI